METTFKIARNTPIAYDFNPQTCYYQKSIKQPSAIPCPAMPYELRRERTMADQIKNHASEILTKREYKKTNGSKQILTGLQPTVFPNWYMGNHYNPKGGEHKISDILFYFYPDNDRMIAFYFSGFHSNSPAQRAVFAASTIPQLIATNGL